MKRIKQGLVMFVLIILNHNINAQQSFGIKAGVQFSKMKEFVLNTNYLTSLQAKGIGVFKINKSIALTPSIGYSGKGFVYRNLQMTDNLGNTIGTADAHNLFNYIQLTVPVSYSIGFGKANTLFFGAGPYFAYALSGKGKLKNINGTVDPSSWALYSDDTYKRTDAGLVIELSGTLNQRFLISLNTDFGFTDVFKGEEAKMKTIAGGLSIGYLFQK